EEEVPPGADRVGVTGLESVAGLGAGLDHEAQQDADGHRDEGRDREPQERLTGQPSGVLHAAQVRDAGDDRREDQGHDGGAQQRHVRAPDAVQGVRQHRRIGSAGAEGDTDEADGDAEDEGYEDLESEGGQELPDRSSGVWRLLGAGCAAHGDSMSTRARCAPRESRLRENRYSPALMTMNDG